MFSPEKERMHDPMAARCDSVGPDLPRNAFTGRSCERLDGARDDASLPSGDPGFRTGVPNITPSVLAAFQWVVIILPAQKGGKRS
jgi:hypothetical protein